MTEEQVFLAALDLPDEAARTAYLKEACGDDTGFRRQVEALLANHFRSGEFLNVPAAEQIDLGAAADIPVTVQSDAMGANENPSDEDEGLSFLSPGTRPDSLGRLGHYEVLQVLGKGGFGIVFRAFDDILQRIVAIKVMAPQLAATSPARKRFLREARSSAQVRHENVVQVYEVGEQPLPHLAMEFIPGETLQQRLDRVGPLDVLETLRIGRQIAEGLAAAHATDLIHRDIKPGNVLLEGGQHKVKITDFGLARAADDASMTQSGMIAGTPMYMAPEQALGQTLDQRADLFSLGSVMYQMVAGRAPFRANTTIAVLKRVAEDTPRNIREVIPETPQWLCDIIAKLHAKDPDKRYQSAREVADVLADCEAQLKVSSRLQDFSRIPRSPRGATARRKWLAAAAVLLPFVVLAAMEYAGITQLLSPRPSVVAVAPKVKPEVIPASVTPDAEDWVQLFNGKDLTGWKTHPEDPTEDWTVEDGAIVARGQQSYLFTARGDYEDFHLRAEAQINAAGDGGLVFRSDFAVRTARPANGVAYTSGYEAQIGLRPNWPVHTGSLSAPVGKSAGDGVLAIGPLSPHRSGEWFQLEVIAQGSHLQVFVDGKPTVNYHDETARFKRGHLALQTWGAGNTVIRFRKIEIKELPPSTSPAFKNSLGMEFVLVPKGKSWLGGSKDKPGDQEVEIPADFYLGKYEVTQEEWEKVMGENPSHFSRTGGSRDKVRDIPDAVLKRFPVENVSWDQCQVFVAKLNQREKESGWVYRLPKEVEWEYACRGGPMPNRADSAFDFYLAKPSNDLLPYQANIGKKLLRTCRVGTYAPNLLGLRDMHGNVSQWCEDAGHAGDGSSVRAVRGGGWDYGSERATASRTAAVTPQFKSWSLGLRLARVPVGAPLPELKTQPPALGVLNDAVLLMSFEQDAFYEKNGQTYVRDLSRQHNDGLCDNIGFTPAGEVGGGLACKGGRLALSKSLISGRTDYTVTMWVRANEIGPNLTAESLYVSTSASRPQELVFKISIPHDRSVVVDAWNPQLRPRNWHVQVTPLAIVPRGEWFFLAVTLSAGGVDKGDLRVTVNDVVAQGSSQLVETSVDDLIDILGPRMTDGVLDEVAVFQRALSDKEIAAIRALGLQGTLLDGRKPEPPPLTIVARQVDEVRKELMRLNPGFDGKLTPTIENDVVTELSVNTDQITNIAPVRALTALVYLDCRGTYPNKGILSDLTPIKGMKLSRLDCSSTQISDLSPLAGMPLTFLQFNHNPIHDLSPLTGMLSLEVLGCAETKVSDFSPLRGLKLKTLGAQLLPATDLSPLAGMPLVGLDLYGTVGVTSLAPLKGMPLEGLNLQDVPVSDLSPLQGMTTLRTLLLQGCKVSDLSPLAGLELTDLLLHDKSITDLAPLKGMALTRLSIHNSGVGDLTPLQGMPLVEIRLNPKNITLGMEVLREIKSLTTIGIDHANAWPPAEFWERHDKGEFKE